MSKVVYKTTGTCSKEIHIEIEDGIVKDVKFIGGCPGNTQGVAKLCLNRPVNEIIDLLDGIKCGFRPTSCPDQLAQSLKKTL